MAETWRYGDESIPEVGVTFFAGTFVRHPLALAAARAVLLRLKEEGPELQRKLNLRTTRFVEMLNAHAEKVEGAGSRHAFRFVVLLQLPARFAAGEPVLRLYAGEGHAYLGGPARLSHSGA